MLSLVTPTIWLLGTQHVVDRPDVAQCILGIDPRLSATGYAVIRRDGGSLLLIEAGVIRSRARDRLGARLKELSDGVREVIAAHPIDAMALTQLFSSNCSRTTSDLEP
ncbi:Holliday junction resolvasome RuvABC endonuclease subunit [Rhodopirellula rubra]|uniref:Holliday junction resolvasome RuvABC endonuclease subunit n=1 Tax=Aporhodopirellula rubra TaxID=980271 RepID=A0A7W5E539_9BACT|nr:crossover junction endodeoxyribonuclease RuvC [Aporhodopirellula rubra]MBB3210288.1 Holliday junction resolvasome RuvABC endonuclease subunit [Aporhodopirellula rubra]